MSSSNSQGLTAAATAPGTGVLAPGELLKSVVPDFWWQTVAPWSVMPALSGMPHQQFELALPASAGTSGIRALESPYSTDARPTPAETACAVSVET